MITSQGQQFRYDKWGNLIRILSDGQVQNQYAYGPLNRLEHAENMAGEEVSYSCNGLGHRIGKQEKRLEKDFFVNQKTDYVVDLTKQYHNLLQREEDGKNRLFCGTGM